MVRPTRIMGAVPILSHGMGSTYTGQVDSLSFKDAVVAATTANITIATGLNVGDTIDGITLIDGDRVLVKDQTAAEENGLYVAGATPERATDMDQSNEILGTVATVISGTANGGTTWRVTNTASTTIDVDDINWAEFGAGSTLTVEDGATSVSPVDTIVFDGATVTDDTGGQVTVEITGGGEAGPHEIDYVEKTSDTSITATTEATANTIVTGSAVTYDGSTTVVVEFFSPNATPDTAAAGRSLLYWLYDGSSSIGRIGAQTVSQVTGGNSNYVPVRLARRLTPSAAAHTYSIRASVSAGTGTVTAGAGGAATNFPAFIRITRTSGGGGGSSSFVGVKAYLSGNQTVTANAETSLAFNGEEYDTDAFHDTVTNNSRITIPTGLGGKYLFYAELDLSSSPGNCYLQFRKNGSTYGNAVNYGGTWATSTRGSLRVTETLDLVAGDYVEVRGLRASGTVFVGTSSWVMAHKLATTTASGARAVKAGTTAIASGSLQSATLTDADTWDTDAFHDISTNTDRLTIPTGLGGKYTVMAQGSFAAATFVSNSGAIREIVIQKNATTTYAHGRWYQLDSGNGQMMNVSAVVDLAAGDYVNLKVGQYTGSNLNISALSFTLTRLGA